MSAAQRLRELLARGAAHHCPAAYDALSARMTRDAGFPMTFVGGAAVAATRLGVPDIGLISFGEMLDQLRNICAAVPGYPVLADGDGGYGDILSVRRTVVDFARAGAAAVSIGDESGAKGVAPIDARPVVSFSEARMRLRAAADAKKDADVLLLARTGAHASGLQAAIDRCKMFEDEGADVIVLEAPHSEDELRKFVGAVRKPCLVDMASGGSAGLGPAALAAIGVKLVVDHALIAATVAALRGALRGLKQGQCPSAANLDEVTGFAAFEALVKRYKI